MLRAKRHDVPALVVGVVLLNMGAYFGFLETSLLRAVRRKRLAIEFFPMV
jgi:hypothetical protein